MQYSGYLLYLPLNQSWSAYDQHMGYWNTTNTNILNALSLEARAACKTLQLQQELAGSMGRVEGSRKAVLYSTH